MENQLVRTDKFLYKVKRFFRLLFIKKDSQLYQLSQENQDAVEALDKIISCKTEVQEAIIKNQLAMKLIKNELAIKDLADEEIENMIDFFKQEIKNKNDELEVIKKEIISLKKKKEDK